MIRLMRKQQGKKNQRRNFQEESSAPKRRRTDNDSYKELRNTSGNGQGERSSMAGKRTETTPPSSSDMTHKKMRKSQTVMDRYLKHVDLGHSGQVQGVSVDGWHSGQVQGVSVDGGHSVQVQDVSVDGGHSGQVQGVSVDVQKSTSEDKSMGNALAPKQISNAELGMISSRRKVSPTPNESCEDEKRCAEDKNC